MPDDKVSCVTSEDSSVRPRTAKITAAIAGIGVLLTALAYVVFWQEMQVRYHLHRLGSDPEHLKEILSSPENSPRWLAMTRFLETYDGKQRLFEIVIEAHEELISKVPGVHRTPLIGLAERDGVAVRWDLEGFEILKYPAHMTPRDVGVPLETFLPDLVERPYYPYYTSASFADFVFSFETSRLEKPGFEPLGFPYNKIRLRADHY